MGKTVKFPMYFEVCGIKEIPLPDYVDASDEDMVKSYIADIWDNIGLPDEYEYVGDRGFDPDAPIEIEEKTKNMMNEPGGTVLELYERDGKIGILVSPGYGAGWSTWNEKELAYDKRVVDFWLAHKDDKKFMTSVNDFRGESDAYLEAKEFFASIGYDTCPYMGGFPAIEIRFVPKGVPWRINEYDGNEYLEYFDDAGFTAF